VSAAKRDSAILRDGGGGKPVVDTASSRDTSGRESYKPGRGQHNNYTRGGGRSTTDKRTNKTGEIGKTRAAGRLRESKAEPTQRNATRKTHRRNGSDLQREGTNGVQRDMPYAETIRSEQSGGGENERPQKRERKKIHNRHKSKAKGVRRKTRSSRGEDGGNNTV